MGSLFIILFIGLVALSIITMQRRSGLRRLGRFLLGSVFLLLLLATAALVIGSIALNAKGGGVLFLFAMPLAFMTWIAGSFFFASLETNEYYALSTPEKIQHNIDSLDATLSELRESIARKTAEKNKFLTSQRRRQQLDREIAHETMMLSRLPALREGLQKPEAYTEDES